MAKKQDFGHFTAWAEDQIDIEAFKAWRDRHDLTQTDVSVIIGTHLSAIKKWETGARKFPPYIGLIMASIEIALAQFGKEALLRMAPKKKGEE